MHITFKLILTKFAFKKHLSSLVVVPLRVVPKTGLGSTKTLLQLWSDSLHAGMNVKALFSFPNVQRDSYIESPPVEEMSLSFDDSGASPSPLVNRKVSAILPRPAQRSDSTVSTLTCVDELSPFGWYVDLSRQELVISSLTLLSLPGFI